MTAGKGASLHTRLQYLAEYAAPVTLRRVAFYNGSVAEVLKRFSRKFVCTSNNPENEVLYSLFEEKELPYLLRVMQTRTIGDNPHDWNNVAITVTSESSERNDLVMRDLEHRTGLYLREADERAEDLHGLAIKFTNLKMKKREGKREASKFR